MIPKSNKHVRGQSDHIDAWLMSYADLITLLFIFFVIFVSISYSKPHPSLSLSHGEPEHPYLLGKFGALALATPFEETYHTLVGIVASNRVDSDIAVEKTERGLLIDVSGPLLFDKGSAELRTDQIPMLQEIAKALKNTPVGASVVVEGYTDDTPAKGEQFANNWELSAMRAVHIVNALAENGVDSSHLSAISYGSNRPLVPNYDILGHPIAENRTRNQRLVIRVEAQPEVPRLTAAL